MAPRKRAATKTQQPAPAPMPVLPRLVRARAQANVGDLRAGQVVQVWPDDPRLGHYLIELPDDQDPPRALLGVVSDGQPG